METAVVERRRHPRIAGEDSCWRELRLRTGDRLALINIAPGGALVECDRRLLPGHTVILHLVSTTHAVILRAVIARCCVAALVDHGGVLYRGALTFDRDVPTVEAAVPAGEVHLQCAVP